MTHLAVISGQELIKILGKIGYKPIRQCGSHIRLFSLRRKPITVPDHKTIGRGLLRKILRDAEMSLEEFNSLLSK